MKGIMKIGIAVAVCAVVASLPASATCGPTNNRLFNGYTYFTGTTGNQLDVLGTFWQVGNFAGANSGGWEANGVGSDNGPWVLFNGTGAYLLGSWGQDSDIVGCPTSGGVPPPVVTMAFVVSSPAAGGGTVFFAGCATSDPVNGNINLGTSQGGAFPAQLVPKPDITGSTLNGTASVTVNIAAPAVPGGVVDDSGCGAGPQAYKIYARVLNRNDAAPTDRVRASGWTQVGGPFPISGPASVVVNTPGTNDIYLTYSLVFADGVETEHVGANSTVVHGGATSSNRPSDFKIIKKPIKRPTNVN